MVRGDLLLEDQGIAATFVGMVGIEGSFEAPHPGAIDPWSPLGALALPWFRDLAFVDDDVIDGRVKTWSSGYVERTGTFHGLAIDSGVRQLTVGPSTDSSLGPRAIGGLRACAAHLGQWTVGSAEAMAAAMADDRFSGAVQASPGQTMASVLWMGPQPFTGCGATGGPFWWIAYGDLRAAFDDPVELMVATVDGGTGEVSAGREWLRLRPTREVVLFAGSMPAQGTGAASLELGEVAILADGLTLSIDAPAALGTQYDLTLVGPDDSYVLEPFPIEGGQVVLSPPPTSGAWSLVVTPSQAAAAPTTFAVTFTARQ